MRLRFVILAALVATAAAPTGEAQVLTERNISLQLAKTIAETAIAVCKKAGVETSAAVVDRAGDLKVLLRSDASNPHNSELARRKAYTAHLRRQHDGVPQPDCGRERAGRPA